MLFFEKKTLYLQVKFRSSNMCKLLKAKGLDLNGCFTEGERSDIF